MARDVLILGGGFGGLTAARRLERKLAAAQPRRSRSSTTSTSCSTRRCCPGAAAGTLEPRHVVVPLREQLRRTELQLGHVLGADPERRTVVACARSAAPRASCATTS